jgi:hypothetical protein
VHDYGKPAHLHKMAQDTLRDKSSSKAEAAIQCKTDATILHMASGSFGNDRLKEDQQMSVRLPMG